jgi:hypothetical protein
VSAPRRGESAEGSSWRQAGGEAGNTAEVAGDSHGATEELGDAKSAPDNGWRRMSVVVRSVAHDTEEDQRGGSHPWSMAAGCGVREVHHVGAVLRVVSAGVAGAVERLATDNVLATAGSGAGWFSWRPAAHAALGEGGGGSRSVAGW